jgi:hypothetical protein
MSTATAATTETGNVDIAADRVGKIYAQAIVEAAEAAGCRREVLDELGLLDALLARPHDSRTEVGRDHA